MTLLHRLQAPCLAPAVSQHDQSRHAIRERVLAANLFIVVATGSVGYVAFLISDIIRGFSDPSYWAEIPVNTIGFLLLCGIAFIRRLPYSLRAGLLILAFSAIALSDKIQAGLNGIGELLLLADIVFLSIFFGSRGGIIAIALVALIMGVPGWLMTSGIIPAPSDARSLNSTSVVAWALATLGVLTPGLMLLASVATIMERAQPAPESPEATNTSAGDSG